MDINQFVDKYLSYFASHEVLTYFEKLNKEGYMDFNGFLKSHTKTDIENSLKDNDKSDASKLILELYRTTKFPKNREDVLKSFSDNSNRLFETMSLLRDMDMLTQDDKLAILFYTLSIFYTVELQSEFIQELLNHPDAWEIDSGYFAYESGYLKSAVYSIKDIKSITDYIKEIQDVKKANVHNKRLYFRGHSKVNYIMQPSVMRTDLLMEKEAILYQEIVARCPNEFINFVSQFEHLVKMQHYGLPTRLMDITSNPLISLYFASCSNFNLDGEVIVLTDSINPIKYPLSDTVCILAALCKLNRGEQIYITELIGGSSSVEEEDFKTRFNKDATVQKLLHEVKTVKPAFRDVIEPEDLLSFLFVNPNKSNERIVKQDGAFILCGLDINKLNNSRYRENNGNIRILKIVSSAKRSIIDDLDNYGINDASLFPEIENIAGYLKNNLRIL